MTPDRSPPAPPARSCDPPQLCNSAGWRFRTIPAVRVWVLLAAVGFSTMAVLAKSLGEDLHAFQIAFFRSVVGLLVLMPLVVRAGWGVLRTNVPGLHLGRAVTGATAMMCGFYALTPPAAGHRDRRHLHPSALPDHRGGPAARRTGALAAVVGDAGRIRRRAPHAPAGRRPIRSGDDRRAGPGPGRRAGRRVPEAHAAGREEPDRAVLHRRLHHHRDAGAGPGRLAPAERRGGGNRVPDGRRGRGPAKPLWCAHSALPKRPRSRRSTMPGCCSRPGFGIVLFAEYPDVWTIIGAGIIVSSTIYIARREARLGAPPKATPSPD